MTGEKDLETMKEGFNYVCNLSRLIAMMPIEDWLNALNHAETIGPILDPTLFRSYIYSRKPEILKKILRAALELKRTIQEVQPDVLAEIGEESKV